MNDVIAIVVVLAVDRRRPGRRLRRPRHVANQSIKAAQDKAGRIVAEARTQQKDLILQAKEEQVRLQRELEEEGRAKRADLGTLERRLLQRDEQLDQRTDMLEERNRKLLVKEQELETQARGARRAPARSRSPPSSGSAR